MCSVLAICKPVDMCWKLVGYVGSHHCTETAFNIPSIPRNENGLVKLTDMGLAKVVVGKTYTTYLGNL